MQFQGVVPIPAKLPDGYTKETWAQYRAVAELSTHGVVNPDSIKGEYRDSGDVTVFIYSGTVS